MGKVAIIGGSGVRECPTFEGLEWHVFDIGLKTFDAFGEVASDGKIHYQINGDVMFIPRHGHGQDIFGPSVTNYAGNLVTAKIWGADVVIATSAVGSLNSRIGVEDLVVSDDVKDETNRNYNLFGNGFVTHFNQRPPFSEGLREILLSEADVTAFSAVHDGGTCVIIPGDGFGSKAEGKARSKYASIVGMTMCPETQMALQLNIHYAVACFVVDVDSDANHEGATLEVMRLLSQPHRVPEYISRVIQEAQIFANHAGPIPQLKGGIISVNPDAIKNQYLREIAKGLVEIYCK